MISEFHMYRCCMAYSITLWDSMYIHFVDLLTWCPLACILLLPSKSWYVDNSLFPWQILEPKSTKIRKIWHSAVFTWKQDFVTAICYCPSSRLANEWKSFSFWKSLIIHLQANPHVYMHIYTLYVGRRLYLAVLTFFFSSWLRRKFSSRNFCSLFWTCEIS